MLPGLEGNVGVAEAGVGEPEGGVHGDILTPLAVFVAVVEELAVADESGLGIGEAMGYECGGGGDGYNGE